MTQATGNKMEAAKYRDKLDDYWVKREKEEASLQDWCWDGLDEKIATFSPSKRLKEIRHFWEPDLHERRSGMTHPVIC